MTNPLPPPSHPSPFSPSSSSITAKTGAKSRIKAPPPPATLELDIDNFDGIALDDGKDVLVAFTAPWSVWLIKLMPILSDLLTCFDYCPGVASVHGLQPRRALCH